MSPKQLAVNAVWRPTIKTPTESDISTDDVEPWTLSGFELLGNDEKHPDFNLEEGKYSVQVDGLYLITVEREFQKKKKSSKKRKKESTEEAVKKKGSKYRPLVGLVLRVEVEDERDEDLYFDLSGSDSGSIYHLKKGSIVTISALVPQNNGFQLKIEPIQRKRKPLADEDAPSKKKKKRQAKRDSSASEDDPEWQQGFESDEDL